MALNRQYILAQQQAADPEDHKSSVRVATAAPLPAYARVDNVITAAAPGALPNIDGITLAPDESLLLQHGAAGEDNGIYVVTDLGGPGPFVLTRRGDANRNEYVTAGQTFRAMEGSTYGVAGGTLFVLQTLDPIVLNTTPLVYGADAGGGGGVSELDLLNLEGAPITQGMAVAMVYGGPNYGCRLVENIMSRIDVQNVGFVNEPLIAPGVPGKVIFSGSVIIPVPLQVAPGPPWITGDIIYLFQPGGLTINVPPSTLPPAPGWQAEVGTVVALAAGPGSDAEVLISKKLPIRMMGTP